MSGKVFAALFAQQDHLVEAVGRIVKAGWDVIDVYTPYPLHGLEEALRWRRSRLPVACFVGGATGAALAAWFQFWAAGWDWPLNVGGRPWNSLPAFVPVIFEMMVLLGGFSLVFAWLWRSGLYPGKEACTPSSASGLTNDRFLVLFREPVDATPDDVRHLLEEHHVVSVEEIDEDARH